MSQLVLSFAQRNLLLTQIFFGVPALRNVHNHCCEKSAAASGSWDEYRADVCPEQPTVLAHIALLETIDSSLGFVGGCNTSFGCGAILLMSDVKNGAPLEFAFGVAEHFLKSEVASNQAEPDSGWLGLYLGRSEWASLF